MLNKYKITVSVIALFAMPLTQLAQSQPYTKVDPNLSRISIVEQTGDFTPSELSFIDDKGRPFTMADFMDGEKPTILTLAYYECPMLCNLVLNGLTESMNQIDWTPGEEYRLLTVSINPRENSELAAAKKENYLSSLDKRPVPESWVFATAEESQSKALAKAVGFNYFYDEKIGEYAHPAVSYVLTPDGKISRYLYGIQIKPRDLKLALVEASDGKTGSAFDRLLLYCYRYDPDSNEYVMFASNIMRLGGVAMVIFLGVFIGGFWIRERRKKRVELASENQTIALDQ